MENRKIGHARDLSKTDRVEVKTKTLDLCSDRSDNQQYGSESENDYEDECFQEMENEELILQQSHLEIESQFDGFQQQMGSNEYLLNGPQINHPFNRNNHIIENFQGVDNIDLEGDDYEEEDVDKYQDEFHPNDEIKSEDQLEQSNSPLRYQKMFQRAEIEPQFRNHYFDKSPSPTKQEPGDFDRDQSFHQDEEDIPIVTITEIQPRQLIGEVAENQQQFELQKPKGEYKNIPIAHQKIGKSKVKTQKYVHKTPVQKPQKAYAPVNEFKNHKSTQKASGKKQKAIASQSNSNLNFKTCNFGEQQLLGNPDMKTSKAIQVDTLIIGSGPAALGFLVNSLKSGRLNDIIRSKDNGFSNNNGLAIIDSGMHLGGGQLCQYGINSNTSAGGFLKCITRVIKKQTNPKVTPKPSDSQLPSQPLNAILKEITQVHKEKIQNVVQTKMPLTQKITSKKASDFKKFGDPSKDTSKQLDVKPSEISPKQEQEAPIIETLGPFKDLSQSKLVKSLRESYGKSIVPLSMIGHFLNHVGNNILFHIFQLFSNQEKQCRVFYPMHKAQHIQLMQNGDILTKVEKTNFYILYEPSEVNPNLFDIQPLSGGMFLITQLEKEIIYFRTKSVILGNGGMQVVHPQFFNWFPNVPRDRVISSDAFLKKQGFLNALKTLSSKKQPRIVIVGGSHSAFSCAWLLLNQQSALEVDVAKAKLESHKILQSSRKIVSGCKNCCLCSKNSREKACTKKCICKCFGFFQFDDWSVKDQISSPLNLTDGSIKILHRGDIKVFYKRVIDAVADGYDDYDKQEYQNGNGYLYSFTGLRGDAKDLYRSITKGTEKRAQLVEAKTIEQQAQHMQGADLVIWACGYASNFIPIYDFGLNGNQKNARPLMLSQRQPGSQFDVDSKCRLLLENGVILSKVFGCGLGYPVRTNDGKSIQQHKDTVSNMPLQKVKAQNPRADSFSLYMNIVGDILLKNILPKEKKIVKSIAHKIFPNLNNITSQTFDQAQINKMRLQTSPFKIAKLHKNTGHEQNRFNNLSIAIKQLSIAGLRVSNGPMSANESQRESKIEASKPNNDQTNIKMKPSAPSSQICSQPQAQISVGHANQSLSSLHGINLNQLTTKQQRFVTKSVYLNDNIKKNIKKIQNTLKQQANSEAVSGIRSTTKNQRINSDKLYSVKISQNKLTEAPSPQNKQDILSAELDVTIDQQPPPSLQTKDKQQQEQEINQMDNINSFNSKRQTQHHSDQFMILDAGPIPPGYPEEVSSKSYTNLRVLSENKRNYPDAQSLSNLERLNKADRTVIQNDDQRLFPPIIQQNIKKHGEKTSFSRYQNNGDQTTKRNTQSISRKQALREELITKVVKNEEHKLKQLRIFSGGSKAPQTFVSQNKVIPLVKQKSKKAGRTTSKVDTYDQFSIKQQETATRNKSPFSTNLKQDRVLQKGMRHSKQDPTKQSDDNKNTIFTITNDKTLRQSGEYFAQESSRSLITSRISGRQSLGNEQFQKIDDDRTYDYSYNQVDDIIAVTNVRKRNNKPAIQSAIVSIYKPQAKRLQANSHKQSCKRVGPQKQSQYFQNLQNPSVLNHDFRNSYLNTGNSNMQTSSGRDSQLKLKMKPTEKKIKEFLSGEMPFCTQNILDNQSKEFEIQSPLPKANQTNSTKQNDEVTPTLSEQQQKEARFTKGDRHQPLMIKERSDQKKSTIIERFMQSVTQSPMPPPLKPQDDLASESNQSNLQNIKAPVAPNGSMLLNHKQRQLTTKDLSQNLNDSLVAERDGKAKKVVTQSIKISPFKASQK